MIPRQGEDATRRKRHRWQWVVLGMAPALVALPVGAVVWGAWSFSEAGRAQPVPCADAMAFARASLPPGARDERCTAAHWLDVRVVAEFRVPRAEVPGWLEATYPGRSPIRTVPKTCV